jgi:hypothetical protein
VIECGSRDDRPECSNVTSGSVQAERDGMRGLGEFLRDESDPWTLECDRSADLRDPSAHLCDW